RQTVLLITLVTFLGGAASCSRKSPTGKPGNVDYYTCTMHPSVREKEPGKCPICGMELVPVEAAQGRSNKQPPRHNQAAVLAGISTGGTASGPPSHEFLVPVERQQQIGVTYATVERKPLFHTIRAVGLIVPDKGRNWQFVSRVDGYVQKLQVTAPGELVDKNAPLLSIYSPDLLTSQRETVETVPMREQAKSKDSRETPQPLIQSARRRLQLWNVTQEQIADLEKTRKASDTLTLLSPFRGVVQSVPVEQGKNVKVGDMLVEVADLSVVWVWAEFYENELPMLQVGQ